MVRKGKKQEVREPPGIQIQDILTQPSKYRTITKHTDFENNMTSAAYWQVRILNLKGCIVKIGTFKN
ncbi:hypothetical protein KAX02_00325 [candidate division WOR-3 bacterium]|nr:hypothetical protein [candidate division WOR-3 bacterium]